MALSNVTSTAMRDNDNGNDYTAFAPLAVNTQQENNLQKKFDLNSLLR